MRRLVLICVMLLLPVQWTWAAAAAYCAHEPSPSSWHIGHHEHVHKSSSAGDSKKAQSAKAGALDLDCEYCHLSAAQWLPAPHDMMPPVMGAVFSVQDPPLVGSHFSSGPERPDRSLAI